VNPDCPLIKDIGSGMFPPEAEIPGIPKTHPLSWLGSCVAIYADDDAFWTELAQAPDFDKFGEKNVARVPLAVRAEVRNPLKLAAFMAMVRVMLEASAPQMIRWEVMSHKDRPYVKISTVVPKEGEGAGRGVGFLPENMAIYYAMTPTSLTVTLSEAVIKRALERMPVVKPADQPKPEGEAKGDAAKAEAPAVAPAPPAPPAAPAAPLRPWLGESLALQVDARILPILEMATRERFDRAMQALSWSNIPILNEWKRLYPKTDPVALHEKLWGVRLICPGGGKYAWNEEWQTMESTVYGHPGQPKSGPKSPLVLKGVTFGNFGITFENGGLRGSVELERKAVP
jgi:hypothetical protein